ncbi:DUF5132 domain-containing protein [Methylobacterium sp. P31]
MKALFIGVGAAAVAPKVLPAMRPLAKAIIKAGLLAYDQGREAYSELSEQAGDLIAEVRAELAESSSASTASKIEADRQEAAS